jgi:hypothetical protein
MTLDELVFEIDGVGGEDAVRNVGGEVIRNWFLRWDWSAPNSLYMSSLVNLRQR